MKYTITLELESESDPREWLIEDKLIIDEPFTILEIKECT